jgi:hydrogenase/urease accessory protein HupE
VTRAALVALALGVVAGAAPAPAPAHPLDPALLDVRETAPGRLEVVWKVPRAARDALTPVLPGRCREASPRRASAGTRSVLWRWSVDCGAASLVGEQVAVRGLGARGGDALLRVELLDGRRRQAVLRSDSPGFTVPPPETAAHVAGGYLALGIEHIASGLDHLLFVLGLVLLVRGRRALLWTITAFTLGHSVTLSLATLGFVHAPTALVEALIAASIVVVALELAQARGADGAAQRSSLVGRRPWLVAFAFGLLHGFGFAGALADVGLPAGEIPLALLAFNLGIELGQLAFVALVLALRGALQGATPPALRLVPAYAIGTLAVLWLCERVALLAGA